MECMHGEGTVAADQLRLFIERIERLEEEKKGIADDVRDVYAEAKANGYDTKTMRAIVRLRKMETHARQEADALLETYRQALGLAVSATTPNPLVAAAGTAAVLVALWLAGVLAGGLGGGVHVVLEYLSPTSHVTGFLRGTLAVADVAYWLSMAAIGVVGVIAVLAWRR